MMLQHSARLDTFVRKLTSRLDAGNDTEPELLDAVGALMRVLVSVDNWLDPAYAVPDARHYRQFLLYADPDDRFSVVSFVCAPGQATPIHDHTVWGVIGVLRGAEIGQYYMIGDDGRPFESRAAKRFEPGDIAFVSPSIGDIHMIRNAFDDRASVSIHVYGGNIGRIERALYFPEGHVKRFMSGYTVPGTAGD